MKIDKDKKTITIEAVIDLVPAENYLNKVVPPKERGTWRLKDAQVPKITNKTSIL